MIFRFAMLLVLIGSLKAEPIPQLAFLKWMEGSWVHESEGTTVRVVSRWVEGGRFLERKIEIQMGNDPLRKHLQTVFWDPNRKEVRSWGRYSDGGLEEGLWQEKEGSLEIRRQIIYPDGKRGKATNHWTPIDAKNCAWFSTKRSIGMKRLPDIPATSLEKD